MDVEHEGSYSDAPTPPVAPSWLKRLWPSGWPRWAKWLLAPLFLVVLVFYFRDVRMGTGLWGNALVEVERGVKVRVDNQGRAWVTYQNKQELPADGLGLVVVTEGDNDNHPDKLQAFRGMIMKADWPVVVFLNATGFDATGEPVVIRKALDGHELYRAPITDRVALNIPNRDGTFTLLMADRTSKSMPEREWLTKYMRLSPAPDAKELEKLSDEELRKKGFERITVPEAKRRGILDDKGQPVLSRPRLLISDEKKK